MIRSPFLRLASLCRLIVLIPVNRSIISSSMGRDPSMSRVWTSLTR
jgi:hypothetical protein